MKHTGRCCLLLATAVCWASLLDAQQIECHFSPNGGCATAMIKRLDAAQQTVDIAAYILTSADLCHAIERASRRGVAVRIVVDRAQEGGLSAYPAKLRSAAVQIRTDHVEKLMHSKYAILDGRAVATGSYNWSDNAEFHNAENLIVIDDQTTTAAFAADFAKHWAHALPFVHRTPRHEPFTPPPPPPTQKGL
jgi:phosphatidylserine/phosphatidylglycerophosphate/cardiolipin synthase-like enzyme